MKIELVRLDDYVDSPFNPRIMFKEGDSAFDSLRKSVDEFDFLQPLIVNTRTMHIVSGHLRKRVLKSRGIDKAEAVIVDFDEVKEKAAVLGFNRISGSWDFERLADILSELSEVPNFDISVTGFDVPEISHLFDKYLEHQVEEDFDARKVAESIKEPVTKKGDIIEIGPHRIFCGDCSMPDSLKCLMVEEKAGLVHTDPPYNVAYMGGDRPTPKARPKRSKHWERIYADNMDDVEYEKLLCKVLSNISTFMVPGAATYVWNGHKNFGPMHTILEELGFQVSSVIVWSKPNFAISYADYHEQVEFCLYAWLKGNGAHRWFGDVNQSTLWEVKRDPTKDYIHPTQKPIALAQRAITNSSVKGEIVLDTFLGSGSTLIAAESLGRRCYGCEIDPRYCDAIIRRYIAYVGSDKVSSDIKKRYMKED